MKNGLLKLAVFVSGRGSNLQALIEACEAGTIPAEISIVVSNNPKAKALERADRHKIPWALLENGPSLERDLLRLLARNGIDLICLAGFMRILSAEFVSRFPRRILNIHPSLLPKFPGLQAQRQALEAGERESGCTVHFVDEGVDTGPIIAQGRVPILKEDTVETLSARILEEEHRLYPEAIRRIATQDLKWEREHGK